MALSSVHNSSIFHVRVVVEVQYRPRLTDSDNCLCPWSQSQQWLIIGHHDVWGHNFRDHQNSTRTLQHWRSRHMSVAATLSSSRFLFPHNPFKLRRLSWRNVTYQLWEHATMISYIANRRLISLSDQICIDDICQDKGAWLLLDRAR